MAASPLRRMVARSLRQLHLVPPPSEVPLVRSGPHPLWCLDSPVLTKPPGDPTRFDVVGWVASRRGIDGMRFADESANGLLRISFLERPDVLSLFKLPVKGFSASCEYEQIRRHPNPLRLLFSTEGEEFEILVPVFRPPLEIGELRDAKLKRLLTVVKCPGCNPGTLDTDGHTFQCQQCRSTYPRSDERFDFLTPALRQQFGVVSTDRVSSNSYDGEALNLIHGLADGLILDCGAGSRENYYANVVNYEIVAYDSTDVLGVGESLPFRDSSFDAVFSFAVLEHVKDPFRCAGEILRVLKPGGKLLCHVPFLQPQHGYPHHYYNMTREGLVNLFGGGLKVEKLDTHTFGEPIFGLTWILNEYLGGLPYEVRERFKRMRLEDLLEQGHAYLGMPFVTELSQEKRQDLSCCNALIGVKAE